MTHLTPDELLDAMEGLLAAGRRPHLETCDHCRRELAAVSSTLSETQSVDVPDPSPLFWQHFSERVRTSIDAEPVRAGGWAGGLRWQVLAPLGGLALIVMALVFAMPVRDDRSPDGAVSGTEVSLSDESWVLVVDMVGDVDWDTANAAGVVPRPGAVEQALLELTLQEQQELTRLLRAELQRAKKS
jgi:hypothetical protein